MFSITGLDSCRKHYRKLKQRLGLSTANLALTFNPEDPASIEAAIAESERLVDERLGTYAGNTIVGPLIQQMKDAFRTAVPRSCRSAT